MDISYVYNGYSPISAKLIDLIFEAGGIGNLIALKKTIWDFSVSLLIKYINKKTKHAYFLRKQTLLVTLGHNSKKNKILVYFLEGISYGEIAAIRFL